MRSTTKHTIRATMAALALFAGSACLPLFGEPALSEMTLKRHAGEVKVQRGDETIVVEDELALQPRDVIETEGWKAQAVLRLEGERVVHLRGSSQVRVLDDDAIEGQAGRLLARAGDPIVVVLDDAEVSAQRALFRVDRAIGATRIGVLDGRVSLSAPGQARLGLERLFQASIAARELQSPVPYQVEGDEWDQTWLSDVIQLDEDLRELRDALALRSGRSRPDLAYFSALAGRKVGFVKPHLSRPPADLLTGFTVADQAEMRLRPAFKKTFALFDDGGSWGVIASIMDVAPKPLVAQLNDVILATGVASSAGGDAQFTVAAAVEAASPDGTSASATANGGETITTASGNDGGTNTGGNNDDERKKPKSDPSEPPQDCTDTVSCAINDAEDRLAPSPSPSPSL